MIENHPCKICGIEFQSLRSLHAHLKIHDISKEKYYETYFTRRNLWTNLPITFKTLDQYFFEDFSNYTEMINWLEIHADKGKEFCRDKFIRKLKQKPLEFAPSHVYCLLADLPNPYVCKKFYPSYNLFCKELGLKPLLTESVDFSRIKTENPDITILVDTREQNPLLFNKSREQKLHIGDYTAEGEKHNNIFIERKSESDFKTTFTMGIDRFRKEMDLCVESDSYIFVCVESFIERIENNNEKIGYPVKLAFLWHNVKQLLTDYPNHLQFIFCGNRGGMKTIIPILLDLGGKSTKIDWQYLIDKERKIYQWLGM